MPTAWQVSEFMGQLCQAIWSRIIVLEIAGLIVDDRLHRHGIGRDLVARVEGWAVERGAIQSSVRCRTSRPEAHMFYGSLGYVQAKTQVVFRKPLSVAVAPAQ